MGSRQVRSSNQRSVPQSSMHVVYESNLALSLSSHGSPFYYTGAALAALIQSLATRKVWRLRTDSCLAHSERVGQPVGKLAYICQGSRRKAASHRIAPVHSYTYAVEHTHALL